MRLVSAPYLRGGGRGGSSGEKRRPLAAARREDSKDTKGPDLTSAFFPGCQNFHNGRNEALKFLRAFVPSPRRRPCFPFSPARNLTNDPLLRCICYNAVEIAESFRLLYSLVDSKPADFCPSTRDRGSERVLQGVSERAIRHKQHCGFLWKNRFLGI